MAERTIEQRLDAIEAGVARLVARLEAQEEQERRLSAEWEARRSVLLDAVGDVDATRGPNGQLTRASARFSAP